MKRFVWQSTVGVAAALCAAVTPITAFAHSAEAGVGFVSGLTHPIFGLDHFLAMLSVGIISAKIGGRHIWTLPAMFVTFMVIGGLLGIFGVPVPFVEYGIALSVVALGLAIALIRGQQGWLHLVMVLTCCFGLMHGHAHGEEMPNSVSPVYYSFGFLTTTSAIHLLGVLIGHQMMERRFLSQALRGLGAAISGAGIVILAGNAGIF